MSALAARRAAGPSNGDPSVQPFPPLKRATEEHTIASEYPTSPSSSELDGFDTSPILNSKRRRKERSPKVKARYFVQPVDSSTANDINETNHTQHRRFSPSRPADEGDADNLADSSIDEDGSERGTDIDDAEAVERTWNRDMQTYRPSIPVAAETPATAPTSNFAPQWGVNLQLVSEADLLAAGITDDISGPGVIVSLSERENLMLAGLYTVTPLHLPLSILSATLQPAQNQRSVNNYSVFAPTSHPLPIISLACQSGTAFQASPVSLSLSRLALPSSFRLHHGEDDPLRTLLMIRENRCGLDNIRAGGIPGFSNIFLAERGSWSLRGVHPIIGSFPTPVHPYVTPLSWQSALNRFVGAVELAKTDIKTVVEEQPIVALIRGPKRAGKSSFGRALLNRLLSQHDKVAWLECDLGQAEFVCGGVVGIWVIDTPLLGPSFTHPRIPLRACYLGTYTPLTCPDEYIAAIRHLLDHYHYDVEYPHKSETAIVPLIINTHGWVKGLGEDLLQTTVNIAEPTHVFTFEDSQVANGHPKGTNWTSSPPWPSNGLHSNDGTKRHQGGSSTATAYHTLETAPTSALQTRYTSADFRILSLLTYLHANLDSFTWDFIEPLIFRSPWQIELGSAIEQIILVGEGSDGVMAEDLPLALNGSIVALLETTENFDGPPYLQGRPYPSIEESNFLGLALIRAVDDSSPNFPKLHLLSPLPPPVLAKTRIMVKNGAIELPLCGMMDWRKVRNDDGLAGMSWEDVPFLEMGGPDVIGGEKKKFRRNLMRKGM